MSPLGSPPLMLTSPRGRRPVNAVNAVKFKFGIIFQLFISKFSVRNFKTIGQFSNELSRGANYTISRQWVF